MYTLSDGSVIWPTINANKQLVVSRIPSPECTVSISREEAPFLSLLTSISLLAVCPSAWGNYGGDFQKIGYSATGTRVLFGGLANNGHVYGWSLTPYHFFLISHSCFID